MTKQQEAQNSSVVRSLVTSIGSDFALTVATAAAIAAGIAVATVGGLTLASIPAQAASSLQLQTFKAHSRLSINLDASVETEWKESNGNFSLLLKGVALADLYLGGADLAALRDSRLSNVKVSEGQNGVTLTGKWNFPGGDSAVADPQMEKFMYREQEPARLVVDFWPKPGVTVAEVNQKLKEKARNESISRAENESKKRQDRRIAASAAMAVESDVARFCKEPMKEGSDLFLEFFPFHEAPNLAAYLPTGQPDENYPFIEPKKGAPDEKYVKLALELYAKRDYALAVRTLDFFDRESPMSIHRTDMRFLRANALLRLNLKDQANALFEEIREKNPGTPAALASALYLAELKRKDGNDMQVIERYLWIANQFPKHRDVWAWRMLAAEALYRIKQTDRAVAEYEWIEANGPTLAAKAEASLRIGDAYLYRSQYDKALAAYYRASQKFPAEFSKTASAQINRAEALYWLDQLDRAETEFESFVKMFPGHPAGWRALLRTAEINARKSGDEASEKSRALLLATVNRFPFSPGAVIARMRLIPCGDHGGFDARTASSFFKTETEQFDGKGEVRMERFGEFRSAIRVRSMILLDDPVAALDAAIRERDEVSRKSGIHEWLKDMERKLFRKQILGLLNAGKQFEAVQFYDRYSAKVNLSEDLSEDVTPDRVALADPEYLLRLSRVASELGLGRTADQIAKRYDSEAKNLGISRSIASADLETRLKQSERAFTEAKALWTLDPKKNESEIRAKLAVMVDQSPFAFQKEIILGLMAEKEKKWTTALSNASKATLLLAKQTKDDSVERQVLDQWVAQLYQEAGNLRASMETYRKLQRSIPVDGARAKSEGVGLKPLASREVWMLNEAEIAGKLGQWGASAEAYGRAVDAGLGGNRAIVGYALSLEKTGKEDTKVATLLKKAAESEQNDFWKDLARKKLAGVNAMEGKAQ